MRRFCLRHLSSIFCLCLIVTSSYVLFDLLDIDGSSFKEHAQVCGFEAVMPTCSGEVRPPSTKDHALWTESSRTLLYNGGRLTSLGPRPALVSVSRSLRVHTRKATQREPASLARGSDPSRRSV